MSDKQYWQHDLYINDLYDFIINKKITEYDMHEAGYNLAIYYHLLPDNKLDYLESLTKTQRKIQIGIYMRDDRNFNKNLTESFGDARKLFIDANDLEEADVVSIKKDAIFVIQKTCKTNSFGNVEFRPKNVYSSYHKFDGMEMYYNSKNNEIDCKGMNDDLLNKHPLAGILKKLFQYLEHGNNDAYIKLMKNFVTDYKKRNLSYEYYRELNSNNMYALNIENEVIYLPGIDDTVDKYLSIGYNYFTFLLPMIQRFYFPLK